MKRLISAASFVVLVLSSLSAPAVAQEDGCKGGIWDSFYPNECILGIPDGTRSIGGIALTEDIDTCEDRAFGLVLSKGRDSVVWVKAKSAKPTGEISPGVVEFEVWISQDCLSWQDAYAVKLSLVAPNGTVLLPSRRASSFTYSKKFSGPIDSYCFTNTCGNTRTQEFFELPQNSPLGDYKIVLEVASTWSLSSARKSYTYSGQLFFGNRSPQPSSGSSSSGPVKIENVSICGGTLRETLSAIKGYEKTLHPLQRKRVKDAITSPKDICGINLPVTRVVCEGVYFGTATNAKNARARATLACAHAKTIQKNVPTRITMTKTNSKSFNGFVYVSVSFD